MAIQTRFLIRNPANPHAWFLWFEGGVIPVINKGEECWSN